MMAYKIEYEEYFTDCDSGAETTTMTASGVISETDREWYDEDDYEYGYLEYIEVIFPTHEDAVKYVHTYFKGARHNKQNDTYICPKEAGTMQVGGCESCHSFECNGCSGEDFADLNGYYQTILKIVEE
jgi:hypothetical protein